MRAHRNLLAVAVVCMAALPASAAWSDRLALQEQVGAAVEDFRKAGSPTLAIAAVDLRSGQAILDFDGAFPLVPASNQKLLTAAFALSRLGKDFSFTTSVHRLGDDILVIGDGDPTFGDPVLAAEAKKTIYDELDRWAAAIRDRFGTKIPGDLVLCVSWPKDSYRNADWPQAQWQRWYSAPAASMNFNNNCLDVSFTITGNQSVPHVLPESRFIQVVNQTRLGRKHAWSAKTNDDDSVLTLSGTVAAASDPISVAVDNPPLLLGRTLADRLARSGVTLGGTIRIAHPDSIDWTRTERIAETTTPLAVVLARSNKRSLNMAAECLFLRAGDGTWSGSAAIMTHSLKHIYNVDTTALVVRDGGGLSRGNRVTAAMIADLLAAVLGRTDASVFLDSLPISGTDGTMRNRLADAPCRGRVLAKTGYIAGVSALSGYVLDEEGKPAIAFSILVNKAPSAAKARTFQDSVCRRLVDYLATPTSQPAAK